MLRVKLELYGTIKDRPGPGHSPSVGSLNREIRGDNPAPAQPHFLPWMRTNTFIYDNQVKGLKIFFSL